jgi:hypothetical protein
MAADTALPAIQMGDIADHRGVRECLQWFTREKQWVGAMGGNGGGQWGQGEGQWRRGNGSR